MDAKAKDDLAAKALARAVKTSAPAAGPKEESEGDEGAAAAYDQFVDAYKAGDKKAGMRALKTFIASCRDYEPDAN